MSWLLIAVGLKVAFVIGMGVGSRMERRQMYREELARTSLRLRRYSNHGAE